MKTRDEEIKQFALERNSDGDFDSNDGYQGLIEGAQWADAHQKNPWTSVKDKLPQLNKICFGMIDGKMPRICMLVKKKNGKCVFNTPNEEYEYPKGKITHWMPIPKLEGGEK